MVLNEWLLALCRYLTETEGYPRDGFPVHTVDPAMIGVVFQDRLLALFSHVATRERRSWKRLWLWPRVRYEIVVHWLYVIPN